MLLLSSLAAANAAPISGVADRLASGHDPVSAEKVALRQCWYRGGVRRCRVHRGRQAYGYRGAGPYGERDYYVHDADKLPFGTSRWWDQMLRENRAGNPGGGRN